jgi:ABC-type polysaccharide/polyol phosphate export permease
LALLTSTWWHRARASRHASAVVAPLLSSWRSSPKRVKGPNIATPHAQGSAESTPRPAPPTAAPAPRVAALRDLGDIARDFWTYRELLYQITLRDIRIRYKQAVMGFGWALFMPALIVLAGLLIKVAMANVAGKPLQSADVASLTVKALPWAFFVGAIGFAAASLLSNITLVTKVYLPREVFPVAAVVAQAFDTSISAVVVAVALPFLGVTLDWSLLWVPVLALLLLLFTIAVGLFLSCANLFFRDVKYIVQVLLTFGIFFTPVLFDASMVGSGGSKLVMLNPLSPFLEGLRLCVVEGHNLLEPLTAVGRHGATLLVWTPWYLAYCLLWSIGGLIASALMFHRLEFTFAEYI